MITLPDLLPFAFSGTAILLTFNPAIKIVAADVLTLLTPSAPAPRAHPTFILLSSTLPQDTPVLPLAPELPDDMTAQLSLLDLISSAPIADDAPPR